MQLRVRPLDTSAFLEERGDALAFYRMIIIEHTISVTIGVSPSLGKR